MTNSPFVEIIGAGLAGCEAALVLSRSGIGVELVEMRPEKTTPAHTTGLPAELVCSNSLKSQELPSNQALLKQELHILDSPLLRCATESSVPAGKALAVDRLQFSRKIQDALESRPNIRIQRREAFQPGGAPYSIIAAGPLASEALVNWLTSTFPSDALHFYDAIAPIVSLDSIDTDIAFFASRRHPESPDYLNCPFTEEEYGRFYDALIIADRAASRDFEQAAYFEACLPLEVIAKRGKQSLAFGPLKPVGFIDPRTGKRPYAVCQLRRETRDGDGFGMVACQTRLIIAGQNQVFRLIPGLGNARFLRWGSCHRNTYMDSPRLLAADLSFKGRPEIFLAGQLCGNEGYVESITTGHLAALFVLDRIQDKAASPPPVTTACGGLLRHVIASEIRPFTPSNFHFGLLPFLEETLGKKIGKAQKHELLCKRAIDDFKQWLEERLERPIHE